MTDNERKLYNRARAARWKAKNRERVLAQVRASVKRWRVAHPEEASVVAKASYAKHRDKTLAFRRVQWAVRTEAERAKDQARRVKSSGQWYKDRKLRRATDVVAARRKEAARRAKPEYSARATTRTAKWAREHPEHHRALRRKCDAKRRALKLNAFVEDVDPRVVFGRDKGQCGICMQLVEPNSNWHVDHVIPLSKGGLHMYANVQLAHAKCNIRKFNKCA